MYTEKRKDRKIRTVLKIAGLVSVPSEKKILKEINR